MSWFHRTIVCKACGHAEAEPPTKMPDVVVCHTCRHVIEAASAQKVEDSSTVMKQPRYFCPEHRVGYSSYSVDYYFRSMVVDKAGTPVGYVKAPLTTR